MMWKIGEYDPDPVLVRALDLLFILHAEHEQNCGTTTMRVVGSAHADPYSTYAAAGRGVVRPASRWCQRGRGAHAHRDRLGRESAHVHRVGEEPGQGTPSGIRAPRLQRLRPACHHHQEGRVRGLRGDGHEPAARHRASTKRSRCTTTTSSAAASTRTSTSTRASSTKRWASRSRCSRCSSRFPHCGLAGALGRAARRQGSEDLAPPSGLHRPAAPRLRAGRGSVTRGAALCAAGAGVFTVCP